MPREYSYEDMEELLEGLGFQQVDITEKFRWRNRNGWSFSAALANQQSMVEAKADDGTVVAISEVRFVATDKLRKRCTTLPQERVTSFKRHQPNSCSVPDAPEAAMGVESEGLAEHKEGDSGAKRPGGSESAPSKRARVGPPDGFVKISNPGGGNCLFHAVAKAVEDEGKPRTHLQMRAMCVAHMQRHLQTYAGYWDGLEPTKEALPMLNSTFGDYIKQVAQPASWAGYTELHALACTMDRRFLSFDHPKTVPMIFMCLILTVQSVRSTFGMRMNTMNISREKLCKKRKPNGAQLHTMVFAVGSSREPPLPNRCMNPVQTALFAQASQRLPQVLLIPCVAIQFVAQPVAANRVPKLIRLEGSLCDPNFTKNRIVCLTRLEVIRLPNVIR